MEIKYLMVNEKEIFLKKREEFYLQIERVYYILEENNIGKLILKYILVGFIKDKEEIFQLFWLEKKFNFL